MSHGILKRVFEQMSLTISPFLCIAACILGFAIWFRKKKSKLDEFMSSLPAPKALPLIGHIHLILRPSFKQLYNAFIKRTNEMSMYKMFRFSLPTEEFVFIVDPHLMQAILRSSHCNDKDVLLYDNFIFPGMLVSSNGKLWLEKRRTANLGFLPNILARLDAIYLQHVNQFLDNMRQYAVSKETFDVFPEVVWMVEDILGDHRAPRAIRKYNLENATFHDSIRKSNTFIGVPMDVQKKKDPNIVPYMMKFTGQLIERCFIPFLRPKIIYSIFRGWRTLDDMIQLGEYTSHEIVTKRIQYRKRLKQNGESEDTKLEFGENIYLDNLLDQLETEDEENLDGVVHELLEFLIAGTGPASIMISWVLIISGMFPEVGEKIHAEIEEFVASDEESMDIKTCAKLEYLDMVIKETLRHFTAPFIFRQTKEDVFIKGFPTIPAGARLGLLFHALHHHPAYWERPMEFYPEHFLPENVAKRPNGTFNPFSGGMRDCLGAKYAMQTMKCVLTQILSKVKFKPARMKPWTNVYNEVLFEYALVQMAADGFFVTVEFKEKN